MKYIIFIILLIAIAILYIYSDKKVCNLRNQILALKKQNSNLSASLSKSATKESLYKNITVIPVSITSSTGIIKTSSNVYIGPLDVLPVIYTTNVNMEVKIFDKVQCNNDFWYYVELPNDSAINSRGWVKELSFATFQVSSSNLVRHF